LRKIKEAEKDALESLIGRDKTEKLLKQLKNWEAEK
jgi:hypothetical protein